MDSENNYVQNTRAHQAHVATNDKLNYLDENRLYLNPNGVLWADRYIDYFDQNGFLTEIQLDVVHDLIDGINLKKDKGRLSLIKYREQLERDKLPEQLQSEAKVEPLRENLFDLVKKTRSNRD